MTDFEKFYESKKKQNITLEDCTYFYKQIIVGKQKVDEDSVILFTSAFIEQLSFQLGRKIKLVVQKDPVLEKKQFYNHFTLGTCVKNEIRIRRSVILNLQHAPFLFFQVIFHELYHVYQKNCYFKNEISYQNYRFIQENYLLSEKYFLNPDRYYQLNYAHLNLEKMANKYGTFWARSYLFFIIYGKFLNEKDFFMPDYCDSLVAYDLPGMKKNLDLIFQDYIKRNKSVVWRQPFFQYEYQLSGERKSTSSILFSLEKEKNEKKVLFLKELLIKREFSFYDLVYDYILLIKNRCIFQDQEFVDLLLKKYIYFKLERELGHVSLNLAISTIDDIIYKLIIPDDNDLKYLLEELKERLRDGVKIRRKVTVEF